MNMGLEVIYDNFHAKLKSFVIGRVSDADTADDILQDIYLKIHSHINDLRESDRLESWLYQITRNAIIDHYRRTRPQTELSESITSSPDKEPDVVAELASSVKGMLNCLPPTYRQALELTEIQGLSQVELANRLNLSVSGAKSRVQRAREMLKEAYLDCCHIEFDNQGRFVDYHPNCNRCAQENYPENCGDKQAHNC